MKLFYVVVSFIQDVLDFVIVDYVIKVYATFLIKENIGVIADDLVSFVF